MRAHQCLNFKNRISPYIVLRQLPGFKHTKVQKNSILLLGLFCGGRKRFIYIYIYRYIDIYIVAIQYICFRYDSIVNPYWFWTVQNENYKSYSRLYN